MKIRRLIFTSILVLTFLLSACDSSKADLDRQATSVAGNIFSTLTAQAPTATPTRIPTSTPTPTATPLPMPTLPLAVDGWRIYQFSEFSISIPQQWRVVYIGKGKSAQVIKSLTAVGENWANRMSKYIMDQASRDSMRLIAADSKSYLNTLSNLNISEVPLSMDVSQNAICHQLPDLSKEKDVQILETNCNLKTNGLNTVRLITLTQVDTKSIYTYQYFIFSSDKLWIILLGSESAQVDTELPTFSKIVDSFTLNQ
jgi:hypothetical protein